jgi:hypothetical protein
MTDLVATVTMVGVLAAVLQLGSLRKERRRAFEESFVQRYWKIMDDLSLAALKGTPPPEAAVTPGDEKAVIAFLRLSEDELDLRARGWISAGTWVLWWEGIRNQLHRWPFDEVWRDVCAREDQEESGEYSMLRAARDKIRTRTDHDPAPGMWRRLRAGP